MGATPLDTGLMQFWNPENGKPVACGTVETFVPGTQIQKETWADANQTNLNSNPVSLNETGSAFIFGVGKYDLIVRDGCGKIVRTFENIGFVIDELLPTSALNLGTPGV